MRRAPRLCWTAALALALGVGSVAGSGSPAGAAEAPGRSLAPGAGLTNDTGEPLFVVLSLAPEASFTNTTATSLRVLTPRELRAVADAVADPRVIAHEDAIAQLEARLAGLDAALGDYAARRDSLQEESP